MDEVDSIIINSLKNINCDIDEEITSLKGFSPDTVISAIVCCLESISPGLNLPKRMPTSMSLRLKLTSQLVEIIRNVGFRGDLGYQSILYSNEIEIRRVLMFLIEKVPRESNKVIPTEAIGYVPRLVKEIEEKVKLALQQPWIPSNFLYYGARSCDHTYFQQSFGDSIPLKTENIQIPNTKNSTEELKQYWVHNLPEVSKQCHKNNLLPSLLFKDNNFSLNEPKLKEFIQSKTEEINILPIENIQLTSNNNELETLQVTDNVESKIIEVTKTLETEKENYLALKGNFKKSQVKLSQLQNDKALEEEELKETLNKLKIKSKTMTILSKEENIAKLKNLVANGNDRLLDLANQWNEVQTPLIEQYRTLKTSISEQELKAQEEKDKLSSIRNKVKFMEQEILEKDHLENSLKLECEKLNTTSNRSSYTRRILEIIANIKKQDGEIAKILKDTRDVQKEINQITGQLDRSFTLSDGLIFKDAKHDEVSRKAYKLLATLHYDCESIIQTVNDLGAMERESRNLQDQIDAELDKDMASKLERVIADIEELKKERAATRKQELQRN